MGPEVIVFVSLFAAIFGMYFLRSRENLAMIEKGMNPRKTQISGPKPYAYMRYALLLVGAGAGLLAAYTTDILFFKDFIYQKASNGAAHYYNDTNPAIYFALLAIGGGLGLFTAFKYEKKLLEQSRTANNDDQ